MARESGREMDVDIVSSGTGDATGRDAAVRNERAPATPIDLPAEQLIKNLRILFHKHLDEFDRLLDRTTGLCEPGESYYDFEVGDSLLLLRERVWNCGSTIDDDTIKNASKAAKKLVECWQAGLKVKEILPGVFQDEDIFGIYKLSLAKSPVRPFNDVQKEAVHYLKPEDQSTGIHRLQPPEKSQALSLISALLQHWSPAPNEDTYLAFGYAACSNDVEISHLNGLYHKLLIQCVDKVEMFQALWMALKSNTMVSFFEQNGFHRTALDCISGPVRYFVFPPNKRPSVFRHIAFIRASALTEPPPVLRRDYGYQLCKQREEVEKLKKIYGHILRNRDPCALHNSCVGRQLWQLVLETKAPVDLQKDRRFFVNIAPHPELGFESGPDGLKGYEGQLFKKRM
ncbi:uncharacterized protein EI97DRAFT_479077 [Westerdykella ornata]|uniref:Uncharacterized protein n=1 Tax=Westerdykella ornata TaxID=318751 RepID=A0A6A6JDC9_WESOR|nr:uncharacterized protein EI97DRAFT_479077 [Westerdykella ornata]KAF2274275.1 hypothetical protein EI97DRAFT_479077 [Westerdykella ornata]